MTKTKENEFPLSILIELLHETTGERVQANLRANLGAHHRLPGLSGQVEYACRELERWWPMKPKQPTANPTMPVARPVFRLWPVKKVKLPIRRMPTQMTSLPRPFKFPTFREFTKGLF